MKTLLLLLLLFALPSVAEAQATSKSRFEFDQEAESLEAAQSQTYRLYVDGATTGTPLVVTCTGATRPFVCSAPIGAFTPGSHSVTVTAGNAAGESVPSTPVTFTMMLVPNAPTALRIRP